MRNCVINNLVAEAKKNKNIMLLVWDLWYWVTDPFENELPDQFINVWIAEQNMIWIAAWLALNGKKVFCYSIVPFLTMRCYEQLRIDVCAQNLDVNLIWIGWWFAYWTLWNTHYGIEDINVMKWLPNMKILSPADKFEAEACMKYLFENKWPFFLRLNRWWEANNYIDNLPERSNISEWIVVKQWADIVLISTWNILSNVIKASEILEQNWLSVKILSIPLVKPMNNNFILKNIIWKKWVFTIEEHTIIGWLWDSIASIIAENWIKTKFKKLWIPDIFPEIVWNQDYMRWYIWIDWESIANTVLRTLQN
jgi:transketolase